MKSFAEHLADCRSLHQRRPAISVPIRQALGLEVADPVHAVAPYPSFVASAMDGYAVRVVDVPGRLQVIGDVPAGTIPDARISPGTAVRVMTGSAVPAGAEAVVPVEDVRIDGTAINVATATSVGRHIRGIGEDVAPGDTVLDARRLVGPAQLAALATHNVTAVSVHPRPRVAILSTGDELVAIGTEPGPVQLVDSNGPGLAAAVEVAGGEVLHVGHVGDDPDRFRAAIDALPEVDLVLTSGGVSMGAYDVVKAVLDSEGIRFENVAMQPGRPQAWGRLGSGVPFLGLPGNPVSALVSFELFGRAALGRERTIAQATLTEAVPRSPRGKRQFLRGLLSDGRVTLAGGPESHLVVGMARANCLIVVEEDADSISRGEQVQVIPL